MRDGRGALLGRTLAGGLEVRVGTAGRGGRELWAGAATLGAREGAARPPTGGAEGCTVGVGSSGGALAGASRAVGLVAAPTRDFGVGAAGSSSQPASSMSNDRFDDVPGDSAPMRPAYDENAALATAPRSLPALSCSVRRSLGACPAQRAGFSDRSAAGIRAKAPVLGGELLTHSENLKYAGAFGSPRSDRGSPAASGSAKDLSGPNPRTVHARASSTAASTRGWRSMTAILSGALVHPLREVAGRPVQFFVSQPRYLPPPHTHTQPLGQP